MKKRIFSALMLVVWCVVFALTLTSCGEDDRMRGIELHAYRKSCFYNDMLGAYETEVRLEIYNANQDAAVHGFEYRLRFYDQNGSLVATKTLGYDRVLDADESATVVVTFDGANAFNTEISYIEAVPIAMAIENVEDGGWGFWNWFGLVAAIILLLLFVFCVIGCVDSEEYAGIAGGVLIFVIPAIIILIFVF